jgi:hypothetical protein
MRMICIKTLPLRKIKNALSDNGYDTNSKREVINWKVAPRSVRAKRVRRKDDTIPDECNYKPKKGAEQVQV